MTSTQTTDRVLSAELEAIATAAHDRLHAEAGEDVAAAAEAQRRLAEAATAAIATGAALSAIADAERTGEVRARGAVGTEVLRQVARSAKRRDDADSEYEQAITRADRLGLSHREIARAGGVSHGTVRAILSRATPSANSSEPPAPGQGEEHADHLGS
jgi:DNA-directed RNA polymerase specialized sigma24 family protein